MIRAEPMLALLRLELAEARRSRWLAFALAVYAVVLALFVWLGLRESAVLGFTGVSRVVLGVTNALLLAIPLVALVATGQSFPRSRASGVFELLLSQPCRRSEWLAAFVASRLVVLVAPLAVLLGGVVVASAFVGDDSGVLALTARCGLVSTALAFAFVCVGTCLSTLAPTVERALVYVLLAWITCAALHDFALIAVLLRWSVPPRVVFVLAAMNPVESARLGMLSGIDPELSIFGPVGFWLATHAGAKLTLLTAIAWPAALGAGTLAIARRRMERCDLV